MRGDTYTYKNLEGSGDILASRRNTPASRFFFSSFFWTRMHARAGCCSAPLCALFFLSLSLYARRSSGDERSAGSQREEEEDDDSDGDDSPESSGSSGRAGCNIRRLPHRGGRRIIQNYLVFSLSSSFFSSASSFFFLLSPLALDSVSATPSKRGEDLKIGIKKKNDLLHHLHPKSYPWMFAFCAQSQIRPLPVESRAPLSSVRVPAGDSYTLHGSFSGGGNRCRCKTGK